MTGEAMAVGAKHRLLLEKAARKMKEDDIGATTLSQSALRLDHTTGGMDCRRFGKVQSGPQDGQNRPEWTTGSGNTAWQ